MRIILSSMVTLILIVGLSGQSCTRQDTGMSTSGVASSNYMQPTGFGGGTAADSVVSTRMGR